MRDRILPGTAVAAALLLPSCALLKVPGEVVGQVLKSSTRVAEKAATTGIDVAGEAAKASLRQERPAPRLFTVPLP